MRPLVKRAKSEGQLEVDSILSTFGQSFILVGLMLALFGGEYFSYSYLDKPLEIMGQPYEQSRVVAFLFALLLCGCLFYWTVVLSLVVFTKYTFLICKRRTL